MTVDLFALFFFVLDFVAVRLVLYFETFIFEMEEPLYDEFSFDFF